ncbi:MAG: adenosylcobinamide-GDP ribazoletransferase [Pseudomonadota bacterium]
MTQWFRQLTAHTLQSVMFLSRIPVWRFAPSASSRDISFRESAYTFALAGIFISIPAAILGAVSILLGLSPAVTSIIMFATMALTTGALHEDGLADVCDGFWGGHTKERKLAIMRDSAIGTYGTLGLIFTVILKIALLAQIIETLGLGAPLAFMAIAALSRAAMLHPWTTLPAARKPDAHDDDETVEDERDKSKASLASRFGAPDETTKNERLVVALLAVGFAWLIMPWPAVLSILVCASIAVWAMNWLSMRHIGGHTGDTLGATQQMSELGLYLGAAVFI